MKFITVAIITVLFTFFFYLLFLVLGVGGIKKNRSAQGLDQNSRN